MIHLTGFGRPFGVASDHQGRLLVTDMDVHGVCRISSDLAGCQWLVDEDGWSSYQQIQEGAERATPKRSPALFNGPHSVAVAPDGRLFITTYYDPAIRIVSPEGAVGMSIGRDRSGPRLKGPATGVFDGAGRLLVSEYALNGIFAYDPGGAFLGALGGAASGFRDAVSFAAGHDSACFERPHMCRALANGDLIVADTWNHRLQRFSGRGAFIGVLGGGRSGWRDAAGPTCQSEAAAGFHAPVAVGVADDGRFVVTDWGNSRLQWFDMEGQHLATDADLGLDRPYDAQIFGRRCVIANSHKGSVLIKDI